MCVRATGKMSWSASVATARGMCRQEAALLLHDHGQNNLISFHSRALFEVKQLPDSSLQ